MKSRRHGGKPSLALWMLVAAADVAIIVASAGLLTLTLVLAVLALVGTVGFYAARSLGHREPETAEVVVRRRA